MGWVLKLGCLCGHFSNCFRMTRHSDPGRAMQPVPLCLSAPGVKEQLNAGSTHKILLAVQFSGDKGQCIREGASEPHTTGLLS